MTVLDAHAGIDLVKGADPAPMDVHVPPPDVQNGLSESDESLGMLGRPFDRRNPIFVGLAGAFGVAVAYVIFRGIAGVASVLIIVGLALFIAIGLNPIIDLLIVRARVMKHTVKVSSGLTIIATIIATLIGGSLLGIIGALIAIPIAATIHLPLEEVAIPRQNQR